MANFVRALVGDFAGNLVGELAILPEEISWRINDVGRCRFQVKRTNTALQGGLLGFGRTILLQFENGLPAWGGVIDPPRRWDGTTVQINAYTGEYLLGWRYTDKGRYFSGVNAGVIFQKLVEEGNAVEETGIVIGDIFAGGDAHSPEYHLDQVLKTAKDSIVGRLSSYDFAVIPALVERRITFTANFYQQRGHTLQAALVEGANLAAITLDEQGPIVNDVTIAGADTTGEGADGWGDGRITASAQDSDSIGLYRRRMYGAVFSDVSLQATLDGHAARLLVEGKQPHNLWSLAAVDKAPARFADYDVGDVLALQAPSYGIGGTNTSVRVLGRDYKPAAGVCNLVVQEVAT